MVWTADIIIAMTTRVRDDSEIFTRAGVTVGMNREFLMQERKQKPALSIGFDRFDIRLSNRLHGLLVLSLSGDVLRASLR